MTATLYLFPASFAQQRLWFLDQLMPGTPLYNSPMAVRLTGRLKQEAMQQALSKIVCRHEALRTNFTLIEGKLCQVVADKGDLVLQTIDLCHIVAAERQEKAQQCIFDLAQQPFDLSRDLLIRAILLRLDAHEHILLIVIHHIIFDAWSTGVLIRELSTLYNTFVQGQPSPLPELPIQYADFAHWQREQLTGERLAHLLAYWRQQLSDYPPSLQLKTDRERPPVQSYRGGMEFMPLPAEAVAGMVHLCHTEKATLFMGLLSVFYLLLHRYTEQKDIIVGTDIANRTQVETEALIGFFVNILPLRADLSGNPTFRELLKRTRLASLDAYNHQDLPFDKLIEALRPNRSLEHTPLVQVLFVFQNIAVPELTLADLTLQPLDMDYGISRFDIAVFVQEQLDGLHMAWNYNKDLFNRDTITKMMAQYVSLLSQIITHPDALLNEFDVLTEIKKKKRVLKMKNQESTNFTSFMKVKPKSVNLSQQNLIETAQLRPDQPLPLVVKPAVDNVDLIDWAKNNMPFIEEKLQKHGGLLFRGFNIRSVPEFEQFAGTVCQLFSDYGDLPREKMAQQVYTSTPYPPDQAILFHNESSHMNSWPRKQMFFCVIVAQKDGETPIVDCREIYRALTPDIREKFAKKHLMYVRNFVPGLDVSWQEFFHTDDKSVVEARCQEAGLEFEWKEGDILQTRQLSPAVIKHPQTGEAVFFNQILLHHISCLDTVTRESMLTTFGEADLPRNVYFGDGTPIPDALVQEILDLFWEKSVYSPWQQGDLIMVDNMLVAHARRPYVGPRKIVVAMGDMVLSEEVEKGA